MVNDYLFLSPNFFCLHPHADTFRIPAGLTFSVLLIHNTSVSVLFCALSSLLSTPCNPEKEPVGGDKVIHSDLEFITF